MSFGDPAVLPALYDGLAAPSLSAQPPLRPRRVPLGPTSTRIAPIPPPRSIRLSPQNRSPITSVPAQSLDRRRKISIRAVTDALDGYLPPGSLLPNKLPLAPSPKPSPLRPLTPLTYHPGSGTADSLTREKKGKMPALSHLLSVGKGRVLSLAADEKYVYAGCQSAENEIVVRLFGAPTGPQAATMSTSLTLRSSPDPLSSPCTGCSVISDPSCPSWS